MADGDDDGDDGFGSFDDGFGSFEEGDGDGDGDGDGESAAAAAAGVAGAEQMETIGPADDETAPAAAAEATAVTIEAAAAAAVAAPSPTMMAGPPPLATGNASSMDGAGDHVAATATTSTTTTATVNNDDDDDDDPFASLGGPEDVPPPILAGVNTSSSEPPEFAATVAAATTTTAAAAAAAPSLDNLSSFVTAVQESSSPPSSSSNGYEGTGENGGGEELLSGPTSAASAFATTTDAATSTTSGTMEDAAVANADDDDDDDDDYGSFEDAADAAAAVAASTVATGTCNDLETEPPRVDAAVSGHDVGAGTATTTTKLDAFAFDAPAADIAADADADAAPPFVDTASNGEATPNVGDVGDIQADDVSIEDVVVAPSSQIEPSAQPEVQVPVPVPVPATVPIGLNDDAVDIAETITSEVLQQTAVLDVSLENNVAAASEEDESDEDDDDDFDAFAEATPRSEASFGDSSAGNVMEEETTKETTAELSVSDSPQVESAPASAEIIIEADGALEASEGSENEAIESMPTPDILGESIAAASKEEEEEGCDGAGDGFDILAKDPPATKSSVDVGSMGGSEEIETKIKEDEKGEEEDDSDGCIEAPSGIEPSVEPEQQLNDTVTADDAEQRTNEATDLASTSDDDDAFAAFAEAPQPQSEASHVEPEKPVNNIARVADTAEVDASETTMSLSMPTTLLGDLGESVSASTGEIDDVDGFDAFEEASPEPKPEPEPEPLVDPELEPGQGPTPTLEEEKQDKVDEDSSDDDFGDFGAFEEADDEAASVQKPTEHAAESSEFGGFDAAASTEQKEQVAPTEPENKEEDDDDSFGDFGEFDEVVGSAPEASASPTIAAADVAEKNTSDDDEFGDFGDFNAFEEAPSPTPPAGDLVQPGATNDQGFAASFGDKSARTPAPASASNPRSDPVIEKASSVFKGIFGRYARDTVNGKNDDDAGLPSVPVKSILDSVLAYKSKSVEAPAVFTSQKKLNSILSETESECAPPSLILNYEMPKPYAHYSLESGEGLKTDRGLSLEASSHENSSDVFVPEVLSIDLPKESEHSPSQRTTNNSREAGTSVDFPMTATRVDIPDKKEKADSTRYNSGFANFGNTEETMASTPEAPNAVDKFLAKIPDLSFMLKSELTLPPK